jgi:hypothetical protein
MVFNAIFNNISVILWRSVLLMEETGVPTENHRQTLSHNVVSCFTVVKGLLFKVNSLCTTLIKRTSLQTMIYRDKQKLWHWDGPIC